MVGQKALSISLGIQSLVMAFLKLSAAFFIIAMMMGTVPLSAQVASGGDAVLDPEVDPNPYDPRREIREWLRTRLPSQWWMNEPEGTLNTFQVLIHVPNEWRGNPVSAIMAMCPEHNDKLWSALNTLELQPFYKDRRWPSVICRP